MLSSLQVVIKRVLPQKKQERLRNAYLILSAFFWRISGLNARLCRSYLRETVSPKLHVGCGDNLIPSWLNTDLYPLSSRVFCMDATKRFPFPDDTFTCVFSEHMIEHITYLSARRMLAEIYRVLKPGRLVRISTPSWDFLLGLLEDPSEPLNARYIAWATREYTPWAPRASAVFVVNNYVRDWGHTFIFDEETLRELLQSVGFKAVRACKLNESEEPELRNLENVSRMPPGFLALESMTLEALK
jgi:predicted SAM-dependent methyltransferase